MAIPALVRNRLNAPERLLAAAAANPLKQVGTPIEIQIGTKWCWASVAAGIHNVVKAPTSVQQCDVAKKHLNHTDCCANSPAAPPSRCNVDAALNEVLDDLLVAETNGSGTLPLPMIRSEIDRRRPVGCAIRFPKSFHFVVVDGYIKTSTETVLIVRDPEKGEIRMSYASLISNYRNDGAAWQWWYKIA
jgi:hypothetical protein